MLTMLACLMWGHVGHGGTWEMKVGEKTVDRKVPSFGRNEYLWSYMQPFVWVMYPR
jgi:hypothetical protein